MILTAIFACKSLDKSSLGRSKQTRYKPLKYFNNDTSLFIKKSIIERKNIYIDKELSHLIKDLQMPIKKYLNTLTPTNRLITPGMYIYFYSFQETERKKDSSINPTILYIEFKKPLLKEETSKLIKSSQLNWTDEVAKYYGKQIIGDIGIVAYNFK